VAAHGIETYRRTCEEGTTIPAKKVLSAREKAIAIARASDEKKAEDVDVLDVRGLCNFTDFFVIATGLSRLQLRAIHDIIVERLKELDIPPLNVDGLATSRWIVLDYGDVIAHILNTEARNYYALERLWGDAKVVRWRLSARRAGKGKVSP
jgi:ribosome-associated protein